MNPSASTLAPGPAHSPNTKTEELRSITQDLYEAIAEALQAQNVATLALQEATIKRARAEEKAKSLLKTNSSLASAARMLGEIVKPNISTPNTIQASSAVGSASLPQEKGSSQVKETTNLPSTLTTLPTITAGGNASRSTQSILYDVLEHQRAHYQLAGYPNREEDFASVMPTSTNGPGEFSGIELVDNPELAPKVSQSARVTDDSVAQEQETSSVAGGNDTLTSSTAPLESLSLRESAHHSIGMLYQCRPRWAVSQNRPIFDTNQELLRASQFCGGPPRHQSLFWQHPVRYLPASDEKNLCRTLIIDFLPLDATMKDVLALIRGGALESIQLFPPIGVVTDFQTARVVFHYELPAYDMYIYWHKYGLTVGDQPIRVLQLGYTYPKSRQLDEDVFIRCYTRILLIDNIDDQVVQRLPTYLNRQIKMGFVIEIGEADDGVTIIEFTSVVEAVKAMRAMQTEEMFHGAVFDFEDDYCQEGTYVY